MPRILVIRSAERVARRSRSSILVCARGNRCREYPLRDISVLVVYGSETMIESSALTVLADANIPATIVSGHGVAVVYGPIRVRDWSARRAQYLLPDNRRLDIAARILYAKTRGMYNVVAYHGGRAEAPEPLPTGSEKELREWEAAWARALWAEISGLLPPQALGYLREHGYAGTRAPRGHDPFNRTITLLHAVLYGLGTRGLLAAGLDPTYGILHRTRNSTPLTFDYTEMFKPLALDTAIRIFKSKQYAKITVGGDGNLEKESIKIIMNQFYGLLNAKIIKTRYTTHRLLFLNAFKLRDVILGSYKPFTYTYSPKRLRIKQKQRKTIK